MIVWYKWYTAQYTWLLDNSGQYLVSPYILDTTEPLLTDTSIVWTPPYYRHFLYLYNKTPQYIIQTLSSAPLVSVLRSFHYTLSNSWVGYKEEYQSATISVTLTLLVLQTYNPFRQIHWPVVSNNDIRHTKPSVCLYNYSLLDKSRYSATCATCKWTSH